MELLYNPELISTAELDSIYVDRQDVKVADLLSFIESWPAEGRRCHALIVGQRGIGKTTIQLKLRSAVNESVLRKSWLPLKFPEELYGVSDLADLFIQIGRLLAVETGDKSLQSELDELAASAAGGEALQSGALKLLKGWHNTHHKSLLLLIENLDQLLDQLGDEDDILRLTNALKANPFLLLIGTSVAPLDDGRGAVSKLGKLFRVFPLTRLSSQEIHEILLRRARIDGITGFEETLRANAARLRALEHFTGGVPRLVLMLYRVLTQSDVGEVQRALEKLLDQVTPYYKAKVESLPPQQRKILDHVARATSKTLQGVMPTEIAAATRLTPNQVSTQLRRLSILGYVRLADSEGRNNYYTLSEPLYAIWHRMRLGREERQRMQWLVDFVKAWYDHRELGIQSARLMFQVKEAIESGVFDQVVTKLGHLSIFKDAMEGSPAAEHAKFEIADGEFRLYAAMEKKLEDALNKVGEELSDDMRKSFTMLKMTLALKTFEPIVRKHEKEQSATEKHKEQRSEADEELWRKFFKAAYEFGFSGKYDDELRELKELEDTDFDQPTLWIALGTTLEALGRYEEAIEYDRKVISLYPDNQYTLVSLGELYRKVSRYEEALECFGRAVALAPEFDNALYGLGVELNRVERHEEAIMSLDRTLEINPFLYKAWFYRGLSLQSLGRYDEALEDYARCLEINHKNYEIFSNRGWLLGNLGRYDEALVELDKSLALESEQVNGWLIRGIVLQKLERYEEALQCFDKVIHLTPDNADAWTKRGWVLLLQDREEEAIASSDRALQIDPSYDNAWSLRGLCLYELGRHNEAVDSFSQTIRLRPTDALAHRYHGEALHALKRYEEALSSYQTALSLDPRSLIVRSWRSHAYFNLGRYEEALKSLDDLLATEGDEPEAWFIQTLAHLLKFEVLAWTGETGLAVNEWNLALTMWERESAKGRSNEDLRSRWDNFMTHTLTALAERKDLREFVRDHISQFNLEERMFPLARALDFLLSGDDSYIDRLSPEVRGVTQDIISKLRRADESAEDDEPEREEMYVP
jgi:tetratricopeptide (TPR) repeat protein